MTRTLLSRLGKRAAHATALFTGRTIPVNPEAARKILIRHLTGASAFAVLKRAAESG
jgi:hypothetical protein